MSSMLFTISTLTYHAVVSSPTSPSMPSAHERFTSPVSSSGARRNLMANFSNPPSNLPSQNCTSVSGPVVPSTSGSFVSTGTSQRTNTTPAGKFLLQFFTPLPMPI